MANKPEFLIVKASLSVQNRVSDIDLKVLVPVQEQYEVSILNIHYSKMEKRLYLAITYLYYK